MVSQSDLTKPIVIPTKVPAPPKENTVKYADDGDASITHTIELRTCSEFTEYAAPVNLFSSKGKLKTVQSFKGEPVVFAIGYGDRLNCLVHEVGISQGWTLHDISPSTAKVISFDVAVFDLDDPKTNQKASMFIAATTQEDEGLTRVHTAFVHASEFNSLEPVNGQAKISWIPIADPKGGKSVTSLLIGTVKGRKAGQSATVVWAGTKQQKLKAATYYAIDPTPNTFDPWTIFSPDSDADRILDIQPASLDGEDGLFVYSERLDRTECKIYSMASDTLEKTNSKSTLQGHLGKINGIYSSKNPWNYTDLIFACDQGVGFINYAHPTNAPQEVLGLPKIGFREVVCSEKINPNNQGETCITMFAVSVDDDLYYIQGSRKWRVDGSIFLASSGLPIRQNVSQISCQFNAAMNSSELIYTGTGVYNVKHLLRDPETTCWSESTISFAAPKSLTRYQAYVTTVSIRSTDGRHVGKNFPVKIKSESMVVLINDYSYGLSTRTREVRTDEQGQLVVVSQASESLKIPAYTIEISREGISHTTVIDAGQRVIQGLSNMNSAEKLANAKSTNGEAIFEKGALENRPEEFEQSAGLLKEFPGMLTSLQSNQTDAGTSTDVTLQREQQSLETTNMKIEEISLFEHIGDALEWLRGIAKKVFKVVFKVVLKGVKLILMIAGKVISFVIDAVGPLVHVVGTFLKDKLGLDFGKIFKMLGLIFDPEKTKQNQKILEKTLKSVLTWPGELVRANSQNLDDFFDLIEMGLKPYLGNSTKVRNTEDPNTTMKKSPLSWLFDNPILKILMKLNPLSLILEAFSEEFDESGLGDDIQVPNFAEFLSPLGTTLWDGFQTVVADIMDFIKDLWSKVSDSTSDPAKAMDKIRQAFQAGFWLIFNTIKTLVKTAWQAIGEFMDALVKFLEAKWKFPFITSLFEWYAEQDFTLMNLCTFCLTRVMGIILGDDNVGKCLDPGNSIDEMSAVAKRNDIFSVGLKPLMSMQIPMESDQGIAVSKSVGGSATPSFGTQRLGGSSSLLLKGSSMSMMSASSKMATHRSFSTSTRTVAAKNELSKEARHRIHKYHKVSKIITCFVGGFKFAAVCMETTHVFAEVGAASAGHHDGPGMALPIMTIITTSAALVGSIGQMCNWIAAREFSDEVKLHLDRNFGSICTGVSVGIGGNVLAVGASIASYISIKSKGSGKGFAALSGLFLCLGSYGETIGVHIVPGFRSDENETVGIALGILECVATTGALVALGAAHAKEPDFTAIGLGVDGLCTFVSTLTGILLVVSDDEGDTH